MSPDRSITRKAFGLFLSHAARYKRLLIPMLITIPVTVILMDFVEPYIFSLVLQKISKGDYQSANLWASFGPFIIAYAATAYLSGVVGWRINNWLVWKLELKVTRDISQRVFSHLMEMSPAFYANRFAGSLVSQANKLTGAYVRFMDATVYQLYTLVIGMAATIIILGPRVPLYALILVVTSIVFIFGIIKLSRPVRDANTIESAAQSAQTGNLADSLSNVLAVKSFAAGEFEKRRYAKSTEKTLRAGHKSLVTTTHRETFSGFITTSIGIVALLVAIIGAGRFGLEIGTLFLIVAYTGRVGERLWEFQQVLRNYNRSIADSTDMIKILEIEPEIKDPLEPEPVRIKDGAIEFRNVAFAHEDDSNELFHDMNLAIKAGEKIGLVGHSGSGKTTLTKILLRYADIDEGEILIDGQDIRNITQDDLRRNIAYVPQEPLLFHRSIAENISYGQADASQSQIEKVAKLAHAHEFVKDLPQKYETLVGERGVKLSGGQKQRVAIARAMIKDAPILVLDEATSALDSESEILIQDALWKLMEGRTAIVIAHRLSTIHRMDRIIVLEDGKIVEQGSHKELVDKDGVYASLWAHQSGGFLKD